MTSRLGARPGRTAAGLLTAVLLAVSPLLSGCDRPGATGDDATPSPSTTRLAAGASVPLPGDDGITAAATLTLPVAATVTPHELLDPAQPYFPTWGSMSFDGGFAEWGTVVRDKLPLTVSLAGTRTATFFGLTTPLRPRTVGGAPATVITCRRGTVQESLLGLSTGSGLVWLYWRQPAGKDAGFEALLAGITVPRPGPASAIDTTSTPQPLPTPSPSGSPATAPDVLTCTT